MAKKITAKLVEGSVWVAGGLKFEGESYGKEATVHEITEEQRDHLKAHATYVEVTQINGNGPKKSKLCQRFEFTETDVPEPVVSEPEAPKAPAKSK